MQLQSARKRSQVEPNLYHLVMDIAWFGLALATTTRFLSVYAIHVGASSSQLVWITSAPALLLLVTSTFSGWWRSRFANTRQAVILPAIGFRLMFFLLALTPFLPANWRPIWLIIAMALPSIPQGVGGVMFLALMRESVDDSKWTLLNSRRSMAMNATIALGALMAGVWLERVVFPLNYQLMFFAAFIVTLISLWHVMRVKPIIATTPNITKPKAIPNLWREKRMRKLIIMVMLTHIPFFMIAPLVPLHLVDGLGAGEGFIALFGTVELAGGVIIAGFAHKSIRQWGTNRVMAGAITGTGIAVASIALASTPMATLPLAFVLGGSWTLVGIGIMNVIAETSLPEDSTSHNMIFMQSVGLATFIGPLLGDALLTTGLNLITVLLVGALIRIIAGWIITLYRAPQIDPQPTQ